MLRHATIHDLDAILAMADKFAAHTSLPHLVDKEVVKEMATNFINSQYATVIMYDNVGMLAALVTPFVFGTVPVATEVAWWVEPEHRLKGVGEILIGAYEGWANSMGCKLVSMACYTDNNLGKFYEKLGYKQYELGYTKEL